MKRIVLHVLTRPDDLLARAAVDEQIKDSALAVQEIDLTGHAPSYDRLLAAIFEAESIQVW
jgi:hypothetical protein